MKIISIQNDKTNTSYTINANINGVIIGCSSLSMMGASVEESVKVQFNSSNNISLTKPSASYGGDGDFFKFILFYAEN